MDFISNLIKRPISLVVNETSTTMDKYPISASLPNTPSELENKKDLPTPTNKKQKFTNFCHNKNNKRPLSESSSYIDENVTDFIAVPEEFLDEFKDILPPPLFPLNNSNPLNQSLLDIDIPRSLSITPPPPPPLTPAMKASQTIDELLSQINDNLQQAGLNDDVLAIVSPTNNSEASKAALNNSKLNSLKTSTTAAGSASSTVFENNSSPHKLPIDPQLETGAIFDDHKQQQKDYEPHQHASKDQLNNSGVNKSSNKFVGLTEFDEAKIPALPGDLNPNIEEQYNLTFEECFIPTLNAQQGTTVPDEFKVDKTHLLLPTEADVTSSDNETFADCDDEKDPLGATFAEPASLDVTDLESFQSAANKSLNSTFNNTMENIADITMEAEGHPLKNLKQTQKVEKPQSEHIQPQFQRIDEDEPMDIDMNATMEIIHNTSSNIQHVEKVLQHAENILQHLEDKKVLEGANTEDVTYLLEKQTESFKEAFVATGSLESAANKSQHLEMEHSRNELSLNKNIELPANKSKTLSRECIIENLYMAQEDNDALKQLKNDSDNNLNSTNEGFNSSTISTSSVKSLAENKTETKLNSTVGLNTSMKSQKRSAPSSPSFPTRTGQSAGFPRSPKAVAEKLGKSPFLEKSDYLRNHETQNIEEKVQNNFNGARIEPSPNSISNNLNFNIVEPTLSVQESNSFRNCAADISMSKSTEYQEENNAFSEDKMVDEKRRTFCVKADENASTPLTQFPSVDKAKNNRRTFSLTTNENNTSETISAAFNLPTEEFSAKLNKNTDLNTSFEPMEVDDHISENTTMPLTRDEEQREQSPASQNSQATPLPTIQHRSQSPSLPVIDQKSLSSPEPTKQQGSKSPLPVMERSSQLYLPRCQSPPLPTERSTAQLPPVLTIQPKLKSPPLPTMQSKSQSPSLTTMQAKSQSPDFSTMQPRKQSSPILAGIVSNNSETQLTPAESTTHESLNLKEVQISRPSFESTSASFASQPLSTIIQKRPSIRDARARAADILSAKEQSNIKVKNEKDVVEKFTPSPVEDIFTAVSATSTTVTNSSGLSEFDQTSSSCSSMVNNGEQQTKPQQIDDEFSGHNLILNPSDFDYLLTKGNNNTPVDRSSLLLKFDPLLGVPVPVNQGQQQLLQSQISTNTNNVYLSPTLEEDEHNDSNSSFVIDSKSGASAKQLKERSQEVKNQLLLEQQFQQHKRQLTQGTKKNNATMSVDVIKDMSFDNDCNKAFENSNSTQSDDKQINYKMDELEKKIKNEVLKTEDIEKKLKDAEQREEALIKRITEKDKTIAKMTGVIEAYEKAIAELIADKEQLTQHYEQQLAEAKADRDSNYHHLTSLETTFSDLHVKYEKSKEMTCQLKESEEALQAEKLKNLENLHLQEQRYDKMKNHAMQQLEIANKKLESLTREHSIEITKLKALLKKEEIARSSINEQLSHKTKENAELVKICDELISGQGSNFSFEPFDPKKH